MFNRFVLIIFILSLPLIIHSNNAMGSNDNENNDKRHYGHERGRGHCYHQGNGYGHDKHKHGDCDNFSVESIEHLKFGRLVAPRYGSGTIRIDARTGDKSVSGSVVSLDGDYGNAIFEIKAERGSKFDIVVPQNVTIRPNNTGIQMKNFVSFPQNIIHIDTTNRARFSVGGDLDVSQDVASGHYVADVRVYVNRVIE